ncbi:hypothetical protein PYCC9005_002200 [Savitreella phatthalungensis]
MDSAGAADGSAAGKSPALNPELEARIAAMRARMKSVEVARGTSEEPVGVPGAMFDAESLLRDPGSAAKVLGPPARLAEPVVATANPAVNFSLLDRTLAAHGFEEISDSDDEENGEILDNSGDDDDDDDDSSSSDDSDSDDETSEESESEATNERRRQQVDAMYAEDDEDDDGEPAVLKTKNEKAVDEEPVKVPDFELDPAEPIELLGQISSVVGRSCVVTSMPQPQTKVLDVGSLLCFEDRKLLGYVADTFGPVILPMFSVRFRSAEDVAAAGVEVGKRICWIPKHAVWVFSDTLRVKGSDASNFYDEEIADDEVEFSDDELEAAHKRMVKQQRKAARGGATGGRGGRGAGRAPVPRPPRPLNDIESIALAQGLHDGSMQFAQPVQAPARQFYGQAPPGDAIGVSHDHSAPYQRQFYTPSSGPKPTQTTSELPPESYTRLQRPS